MKKYLKIFFLFMILINCMILSGCVKEDTFYYDDYLHKIWIPKDWEEDDIGKVCDDTISFYITNIENGIIEGKVALMLVAEPHENLRSFSGIIENGIGECQFEDESGNIGKFSLILNNKNEIEVKFEYVYEDVDQSIQTKGEGVFKPYNLSDKKETITLITNSEVVLNSWGDVQLVGGKYDTGKKFYGIAYLTNMNGDVFYKFRAPFRTGAWIAEAYTEDINEDGLIDVRLIERFDAGDIEDAVWIFIQKEDGMFEKGELVVGSGHD